MQNRSWTRSWPARAIVSAKAWSVSSRTIAAASASAGRARDEEPGDAVLDHLGDPADVRRDDRPRQGHRLEDREALRLAIRRQDRDIERRGDGRDVVAAAGEHDPVGDAVRAARCSSESRSEPSPTISRYASGHRSEDVRPGLDERLVALLGLEPGDDADDLRARLHPVLVAAACSTAPGGRSARGRRRCRSAGPARRPGRSSAILRDDRLRRRRSAGPSPASGGGASRGPPRSGRATSGRSRRRMAGDGRRSSSAMAAFVATTSARYMWVWMTSGRTSARWAARAADRDRRRRARR